MYLREETILTYTKGNVSNITKRQAGREKYINGMESNKSQIMQIPHVENYVS